jgi:hypothetical protein
MSCPSNLAQKIGVRELLLMAFRVIDLKPAMTMVGGKIVYDTRRQ